MPRTTSVNDKEEHTMTTDAHTDQTGATTALPSVQELQQLVAREDAVFSAWRDKQPDKHWAMLDLSALRIGYELGKACAATGANAKA